MRPAFRYYGGKWKLAPWIISHFPKHLHYVEPCGGAASVLLQKVPSPIETYNDLNGDVVNFFRVLRERTDELCQSIEWTPWARQEFELSRDCDGSDLERARRFWVYQTMGIDAAPGRGSKTGWRTHKDKPHSGMSSGRDDQLRNLKMVACRLKTVQIENRPMIEVIERFDTAQTLFYLDPPYVSETRSHDKEMYGVEWSDQDHAAMLERIQSLTGMCILSGYQCQLYDELERNGWLRVDREADNNSGDKRTESLWLCPRSAPKAVRLLF